LGKILAKPTFLHSFFFFFRFIFFHFLLASLLGFLKSYI